MAWDALTPAGPGPGFRYASPMPLYYVPLVAGLLPIFAVGLSYLIASGLDVIPSCVPFIEGCTSISATGRYPPSNFLFRATMLPEAVVLVTYWLLSVAWLRSLQRAAGLPGTGGRYVALLGIGASIALVLYVTFLGTREPFYEFMRRFGIYVYFLFTILAQIFLARSLLRLPLDRFLRRLARIQLGLALLPFALGALNTTLKATLANPDPAENVIEWNVAVLMQAYIALSWIGWRHTGFSADFRLAATNRDLQG
ncbi:MAG: hypothetical protein OEW35_11070 [Gammaproteobacteria bacterium]|nr:hypothetical protein [Gammaproteobacteria bacterium]